jgi:hypothetical protein
MVFAESLHLQNTWPHIQTVMDFGALLVLPAVAAYFRVEFLRYEKLELENLSAGIQVSSAVAWISGSSLTHRLLILLKFALTIAAINAPVLICGITRHFRVLQERWAGELSSIAFAPHSAVLEDEESLPVRCVFPILNSDAALTTHFRSCEA